MRISDWSSDVCSSDLQIRSHVVVGPFGEGDSFVGGSWPFATGGQYDRPDPVPDHRVLDRIVRVSRLNLLFPLNHRGSIGDADGLGSVRLSCLGAGLDQLGRASFRAMACTYV